MQNLKLNPSKWFSRPTMAENLLNFLKEKLNSFIWRNYFGFASINL